MFDASLRAALAAAVTGASTPLGAADGLCRACVELLDVDGAAISIIHQGATRGTFGSSNALSRRLDAYQFVYGEGPCLDAVRQHRPVLAEDLTAPGEQRWPAFTPSVVDAGVRAVFALPVLVATDSVGALDLFRHTAGPLSEDTLSGGLLAARLASLPVQDLITEIAVRASHGTAEDAEEDPWNQLESLERVEIYQATGFLIAQLDGAPPSEAVLRLRGRAFATGQTAWEILDGRLRIGDDGDWHAHEPDDTGATDAGERDAR
jgi:hypothetical protein